MSGKMTRGQVAQLAVEHVSGFPRPMVAQAGTVLSLEPRSSQFPGWVWGRDPEGTGAWVPETFLEIRGERARLVSDYDSTELTLPVGAAVEVLNEVAGWVWCRDSEGRLGWLPSVNLAEASS